MRLNPRRERFCREFLLDSNASAAYIRAGYKSRRPEVNASRLLSYDSIQKRIKELQQVTNDEIEERKRRIIQELERVAFQDAKRNMSFTPSGPILKDEKDIDGKLIAGITNSPKFGIRMKAWDKLKALELLGRIHGFYAAERLDVTSGGQPIRTTPVSITFEEAEKKSDDSDESVN